MADVKMTSFGMLSLGRKEKPVVVRVKRKASQASLDAFWLEINERPLKKPLLDFENLSISDHESKVSEALKKKRLLVQHVETVTPSEAIEDVLQSLLPNSGSSKDLRKKIEARKGYFKKDKKHDQLRSVARQEREELVRNARFEQIWKNRRGEINSLRELCQLYDVVRVDAENEKATNKEMERTSVEDNAILCNYLPLLREYIPSAAEEIESEIKAYVSGEGSASDSVAEVPTEDGYVYDLYTVEDDFIGNEEEISCDYPSVQVKMKMISMRCPILNTTPRIQMLSIIQEMITPMRSHPTRKMKRRILLAILNALTQILKKRMKKCSTRRRRMTRNVAKELINMCTFSVIPIARTSRNRTSRKMKSQRILEKDVLWMMQMSGT